MQNFTLPAYIEHRTRVGGARRPARVHAARSAAAAVDPRRCARRPAPPPAVPDLHAARADGVQRRAGRAGRRRLPALDAVRRVARDRHRQRTQRSGLPGQRAVARPPRRSGRRGEPQLGDDQRQPRDRTGAGGAPRRAGRDHRAALPRERGDLSVPRRRAAARDRARRARQPPGARVASPAERDQHRPPPRGPRTCARHDGRLLRRVPAVRRAVPIRGPAQLRHGRRRDRLQAAVHDVGRRRLPRCARRRHGARPLRPTAPRGQSDSLLFSVSLAAFALVRMPAAGVPDRLRARVRLLPDGDGARSRSSRRISPTPSGPSSCHCGSWRSAGRCRSAT